MNRLLIPKAVLLIAVLLIQFTGTSWSQDRPKLITLTGVVLESETGAPLPGAMVLVSSLSLSSVTDAFGNFSLSLPEGDHELTISFVGFKTLKQVVNTGEKTVREFKLLTEEFDLGAVEVVSTGYQQIPKERATGSFVQIDQQLVDRRVSTSILDRIEDVSSGVIFNRTVGGADPISIRGRSTLFGNTRPLIVIDNLPYEGPLEAINPNDVASITILKDAAAASIWGAQAGNGVIILTTKTGAYKQPIRVSVQSNVTMVEKPDLFYAPQMAIGDFVEQERRLFNSGFYNSMINSTARTPLSPVVETLLNVRNGQLTAAEGDRLLQEYSNQDSRADLLNYYYQKAVLQQHAFQISGGGDRYNFNFSGGYDRNTSEVVGNLNDRITLNARQNWKLLKDKLEISTGLYLSQSKNTVTTSVPTLRPYELLADSEGNPLPVVGALSNRYVESTAQAGLLDWRFIPLEEIGKRNLNITGMDFRGNLGLTYQLVPGLKAEARYQYWTNHTESRSLETPDLYEVRHQINSFTQVGPGGTLTYAIPRGERFTTSHEVSFSHNIRANLNYQLKKATGEWNALAGWELRDLNSRSDRMQYFGYNDALGLSTPVDYQTRFPQYFNPGLRLTIPYGGSHTGISDHYISYFGNASYIHKEKYLLSASARKDMSNLFGVETNQKGVPLWSVGGGWILSNESFYKWDALPYVKVRMTYGLNGNVDKSTTAFTTIRYDNFHEYIPGFRYAFISNPPNPGLRWEKIRIINAAVDFDTKSGRLGGSLEFYSKNGQDLIGETEVPDSNGLYQYRGNFSSTLTRGFDLTLNTINLNKAVRWSTQTLISGWKDEVTEFKGSRTVAQYFGSNSSNVVPLEGKPLFSIYSLPWGGLSPDTGNPRGFLDGELSENYSAIISTATPESIRFHGSARPTVFGSLRNTFDYKGFSLSFNVTFRAGYFFRRSSVDYAALSRGQISHADYGIRWQNPGDELTTQVPSQPTALNTVRQSFYQRSSLLVERGDHVRFQDLRFGYTFSKPANPRFPFSRMEVFTYLNNLGLIWKATDQPLDPDFPTALPQRTAAVGLRIDF